ncbi:conjugal transfer protein TraC [Actinoallomurus sp. NPDC052274]|uniref:VirB4 family type IV secretion system protein n=1 Tax=Actinoallomurus sp. NPDC052274 TaxID=3155420 RepID=UPI00343AA7BD
MKRITRQHAFPRRRTQPPALALGPDAVEVGSRTLTLGDGVCATFTITGYPAEVGPGWLEPLLCDPGRIDVALHIEPIPNQVAADRLRKRLARLESSARSDSAKGRLVDFEADAAADDAHALAAALARGEAKLFRAALYITVHAANEAELSRELRRIRALAASLLLDARLTTFRTLEGWTSTLPLGIDAVGTRRTMDTHALAAAFPFTSPDLACPLSDTSVLYGANVASTSLVTWDRWALDNHNAVVVARSGAGKSYFTKLEALRSMYAGVEIAVIDPEDEYARLADAAGGARIALGSPGVRLNPFDLPSGASKTADALTRRALFLHTLTAVLMGEALDPASRAVLDHAVFATYYAAGITEDPRTWCRPAPLLRDLTATLNTSEDPKARELGARLSPYVTGSFRQLFDGPTTTRPEGHLVVFSLRDVPEELKTVATLLTLDATWRRISDPRDRRRRFVIVDEAWLLLRDGEGAKFLYRLAKSARKYWAGLTVVTQDATDVLASDLGRAVVSNSATQILLRQAPQAIDQVCDAFRLSDGERAFLLAADRGEALLSCGSQRVALRSLASPAEHRICTTNPVELADLEDGDLA